MCEKLRMINYDKFEKSFLALMSQTDLIERVMSAEQGTSRLSLLQAELADVQRQCEKYFRLIEGDENPSKRVVENLKMLEAKEVQLQAEVEAEEIKRKGEMPVKEAYERFQSDLAEHARKPEYRMRIREALREVVEKVTVLGSTPCKQYQVHLRSASMPITVSLHPTDGWLFNPAPDWAMSK